MQHTKEPWFIPSEPLSLRGKICAATNDSAIGMFVVADTNSNFPDSAKADSKRIVACVNALAGLSDDALSGGWNFKEMSTRTKAIEDELESYKRMFNRSIRELAEIAELCGGDENAIAIDCVKDLLAARQA